MVCYTQDDINAFQLWESKLIAFEVFIHGTDSYKVVMYSIKDSSLHFVSVIYINFEKLLKMIQKFDLKPSNKKIVLRTV